MLIEEAIFTRLCADAGVAALVEDRVYPVELPRPPRYPAVVYHRISTPREHTHDGSAKFASPRFQFDCLGGTFLEARRVHEAVRLALDGFKGTMGTESGGAGVEVHGSFCEDDRSDLETEADDELGVYSMSIDVVIEHAEA